MTSASGTELNAGREPRWAIAWEVPPTTATTKLLEILVERGADQATLGALGEARPGPGVGGVTVSNATLHNRRISACKGRAGRRQVVVLRAGDVIPR